MKHRTAKRIKPLVPEHLYPPEFSPEARARIEAEAQRAMAGQPSTDPFIRVSMEHFPGLVDTALEISHGSMTRQEAEVMVLKMMCQTMFDLALKDAGLTDTPKTDGD